MGRLVESSAESESSSKKKNVVAAKRTKGKNGKFLPQQHKGTTTTEDENGETVIKVKMLTGTLYLYRGMNPRAEFVRIV